LNSNNDRRTEPWVERQQLNNNNLTVTVENGKFLCLGSNSNYRENFGKNALCREDKEKSKKANTV
jgi:hypothetical protein